MSTSLAGTAIGTVGTVYSTGLVDRAREKAALDDLLDAVRHGLSGTLVLRGEAGTSTVQYHQVKVFRKLGVTSRTQLARILVD